MQEAKEHTDAIPIGTTSPVRQLAEPGDRRTVEQELDDLAAWAIAWNRDNTESGRRGNHAVR